MEGFDYPDYFFSFEAVLFHCFIEQERLIPGCRGDIRRSIQSLPRHLSHGTCNPHGSHFAASFKLQQYENREPCGNISRL